MGLFDKQYSTGVGQGLATLADAFTNSSGRQLLGLKAENLSSRNLASQLVAAQRDFQLNNEQEAVQRLKNQIKNNPKNSLFTDTLTGVQLGKPSAYMAGIKTRGEIQDARDLRNLYPIPKDPNNLSSLEDQLGVAIRGKNPNLMSLAVGNASENIETKRALEAIPNTHLTSEGVGGLPLRDTMGAFGNKTSFLNADAKRELTEAKTKKIRTNEEIDLDVAEGRMGVYEAQEQKIYASIQEMGMRMARGEEIHPYEIEEMKQKISLLEDKGGTELDRQNFINQKILKLQNESSIIPLTKELLTSKIGLTDAKIDTEGLRSDLTGKKIQTEVSKINKNLASSKGKLVKHGQDYVYFDANSKTVMPVTIHKDVDLKRDDLITQVVDDGTGKQTVVIMSKSEVYESKPTNSLTAEVGTKTPVKVQQSKAATQATNNILKTEIPRLEWLLNNKMVSGLRGGAARLGETGAKMLFDWEGEDSANEFNSTIKQVASHIRPELMKGLAPVSDRDTKTIDDLVKGGISITDGKQDALRSIKFIKEKWNAVNIKQGLPIPFPKHTAKGIGIKTFTRLSNNKYFKAEMSRPDVAQLFKARPKVIYHPLMNMYVIPTGDKKNPFTVPINKITKQPIQASRAFQEFLAKQRGSK